MAVEVGIRELRNNLSRFLVQVREGEEIVVTDRGRAVARIVPPTGGRAIDRLLDDGLITPARAPKRTLPRPVKAKGTVSDLVSEQRR